MRRKVVRHGPATYVISLPSKWIKEYGIKKGDELDVEQEEKSLRISTGSVKKNLKISIDVSGMEPRLVDRFMARTYQKGFDEIMIVHNDINLLRVIEEKAHELMGFEIIEKNEKICQLKCLSSHLELDFDNSLRRAFLITKQMIESLMEGYKKTDTPNLAGIYLKDFEVNRLTYFCLRQLNKEQYTTLDRAQQKLVLYYLIESLEDLADAIKRSANKLAKEKKCNKDLLGVIQAVYEQFDISYHYFYKANKNLVNKAYLLYLQIQESIARVFENKTSSNEAMALYQLHDATHVIYHFTTMRLDYLEKESNNHLS